MTDPTQEVTVDGETYYNVPANGDNNLVTQNKSGTWQMPETINLDYVYGGLSGMRNRVINNPRYTNQLKSGKFAPNADGKFTRIGASLSTPVHPGTLIMTWLRPVGWTLPFINGFAQSGLTRVAKVENGEIIGVMIVQNETTSGDASEEITTLDIDTSNLRDPDSTDVKVPVPQGKYAVSYSTLFGEVAGTLSGDIELAAANYTEPEPIIDPEPEPEPADDDESGDDDTQPTSRGGGSGGCNALNASSLLALAALALAFKFKQRG